MRNQTRLSVKNGSHVCAIYNLKVNDKINQYTCFREFDTLKPKLKRY